MIRSVLSASLKAAFPSVVSRPAISALAAGLLWLAPTGSTSLAQEALRHPIPRGDEGLKTGPAVGRRIPDFEAVDQYGTLRDFDSVKGPNGALILFYRSADW